MYFLREKTRARLQANGPYADSDGSILWSDSKFGREMSKSVYESSELELRWEWTRKKLVLLDKSGAGRQTTTGKTILCHISTTAVS